jgi:hypothetical protein
MGHRCLRWIVLLWCFYDGQSSTSYASFDLDGYSLDENGFFRCGKCEHTKMLNLIFGKWSDAKTVRMRLRFIGADAADFPNGSGTSQSDLLDAMVYGTGDAQANNLITGLGLDLITPGYSQLDETIQQAGKSGYFQYRAFRMVANLSNIYHLSCKKWTPGTWNVSLLFSPVIFLLVMHQFL